MDSYEESDQSSAYNSDEIDSETEVRLYGAIHHSIASEDQQLVDETPDSGIDSTENHSQSKPIESQESSPSKAIESQTKTSSNKPLNNLFKLLDEKIDESDEEFYEDFDFDFSQSISQNLNKRKIDVIEIDDSSDSDVVIIDDDNSFVFKTNSKTLAKQKSPKKLSISPKYMQKSPKNKTQTDISLGNVNNLNKSTLEVMDEFYNEDNYDSEEEANTLSRMSGDRNMWKISHNDILLSHNKNNRYYRSKFICNNCNERGHQARDCPLPKKSPTCFLCGFTGHRSDRCRSILCSRCLKGSHKTINCKVSVNQLVCDECDVRGHETNQCTYNWRKYHLTTTSSSEEPIISYLKSNERKCCYNCGAIGKHFGFECRSKSLERPMIPVSNLMPNTRKSHCFDGRQRNNERNDCPEKALFNEFVKSISNNELSRLSASFNKPLDRLDLAEIRPSTSASTTASTFNNKNKHIKWIYPETNGTTHSIASSYSYAHNESTPFIRNCLKRKGIAEPTHETILYANSTTALNSAHTPIQTHQQINNGMQEKSQTQTTPQLNERSKRRKNRRKKRKIVETEAEEREHQSFKQPNGSNFKHIQHLKRIKTNIRRFRRKNKLF